MSRKGSQFTQQAATIPSVRGGRRAHPPKVLSMINTKRINKKELKTALMSAISATADSKKIANRYETLKNKKIENFPLIVETKLVSLKTKELLSSLKKILGKDLFELAPKKKTTRSGKGKFRGRKYKKNAGLLIVIGTEEKMKTNAFDITKTENLGVTNLARGGPGRLTIYTENAIKQLGEKLK
jgi:large subunit ribosomal protein L4e